MIQFTPEQIQDNWNELIKLIEDTFEGERKEKLLKMYKHFEDRIVDFCIENSISSNIKESELIYFPSGKHNE